LYQDSLSKHPIHTQKRINLVGLNFSNCRTLKGGNSSVEYSFKTGGNYKIKFQAVNLGGASQIYISKYGVGN
jgi:hypothetical protein